MDSDKSTVNCPKFNGTDFAVWKVQMESLLAAKDLLETIQTPTEDVEDSGAVRKLLVKKDCLARSLILLALDNKYVKLVLKCKTAKEVWTRLVAVHEQKSAGSRMTLQKQFYDIQMSNSENVADYVSRVEYVAGQLRDIGIDIPEVTVVGKIVSGLGKTYSSFVSSWLGTDVEKQTLDNLLARLLAEEQMKSTFSKGDRNSTALSSSSQPKNKNKRAPKQGTKKHLSKEQLAKLKQKTKCRICNQTGHCKMSVPKKRLRRVKRKKKKTLSSQRL